ncbi:MAG: histidinol-phosphate aminotransferase family protein [Candidatus Pacebacteria bacterium]|nr:histidinol-phosphate aminotransferase family protein [Candidatus Paceibacterota bacterium]
MKKNQKILVSMKKLYAFGEKRAIDLSLSENPLGCSPLVTGALKNIKVVLNDYPLPNSALLKKKLASLTGLKPANFFIANGSEAIICTLPRLFMGKNAEVLIPSLTFPMFETSSLLADLQVKKVPMTDVLGIDLVAMKKTLTKKTKLIFLCNPNNPTGSVLTKKEIINFLDLLPKNILVVIDEANIEFGAQSLLSAVKKRPNLIILRTFSKGFGLANLRVGFAVASEKIVKILEDISQPFAISGLSEELIITALADKKFIKKTKKFVNQQREIISRQLVRLGFTVFPSSANNLFIKLPAKVSSNKFLKMLEKNNLSLVNGNNFSGFDNRFFRISIRSKAINKKFLSIITKFLNSF